MLNFIKKQRVGFYGSIITCVFIIVSFALVIANGNQPYYGDTASLMGIVAMLIIALVLTIAHMIISEFDFADKRIGSILLPLLKAVACLLIIVAGINFAGERIESFGFIFGSNLEQGNESAFIAGGQAITVIEICIITWLISVVTAFFSVKKID